MGFETLAVKTARYRRALALVGLLVAFTGVSIVLNPTHAGDMTSVGFVLVGVGAALLVLFLWPRPTIPAPPEAPSLGARLIRRLAWDGRFVPYFPVFGIALIFLDLAYNVFLSATPALATEDILVQLSAAVLLVYGLMPKRYARERDFILLFFLFLDLLLVVPLLVARLVTQSVDASVDVYSWTALAPELGVLLSGLGVANTVHAVPGFTAPGLTFTPVHMATPVTLVITTACSGIYSFGIFAAAYIAFLVTEYAHPSRRLWLLLGLGFLASYAANLLRMAIIVLVGYYRDTAATDLQNLLLAHSYAGWLIFLAWLALFWGLLFRLLPVEKEERAVLHVEPVPDVTRPGGVCAICQGSLSPVIHSTRCGCGRFYHVACIQVQGECPACHRKSTSLSGGIPGGN